MPLGSIKQALVAEVGVDLGPFRRGMNRANRLAGKAGRGLKTAFKAAGAAAAAMGAAITAAIGRGIQKAAEFQGEMRKLETLVGTNSDQVKQWKDDILALAPAVGKGPRELSKAMFAITSGGLEGAEALSTLKQAAKASAIGLGNMTDIGRTAAAALTAFGDEGLTAEAAIDQMVATVREGNIEASELTGALGKVIGMADSVGISFAEMNAFVATFTRLGVDARVATTSLRATISSLAKPTKQQRETFQELGTSVREFRQEIQQKGLAQALRDLVVRSEGNIETMSKLIPNVRALSGWLGTAGSQGQDFAEIQNNIQNSLGTTNEGFRQASNDLNLLIERLKQVKNVLLIAVGEEFAPFVQNFLGDPANIKAFADIFIGSVRAMVKSIETLFVAGKRIIDSPVSSLLGIKAPTEQLADQQRMIDNLKVVRRQLDQMDVNKARALVEQFTDRDIAPGTGADQLLKIINQELDGMRERIDRPGGLVDQAEQWDQGFQQVLETLSGVDQALEDIDTGGIARSAAGAATGGGGGTGAGGGAGGGGGDRFGIVAAAEGVTRPLETIKTTSEKISTELVNVAQAPLPKLQEETDKWDQRLRQVGSTLASTIGRELSDLIDGSQSFLETLGSIGKSILNNIAGPLTKALTQGKSLGSALGSLFGGGGGGGGGGIGSLLGSIIPIPGGGILGGIAGNLLGGIFQSGGVVPGRGPVPIMAHGGEAVLTSGALQMLGPARVRRLNQRSGPSRKGADVDAASERVESGGRDGPLIGEIRMGPGADQRDMERVVLRALRKLKRKGALD